MKYLTVALSLLLVLTGCGESDVPARSDHPPMRVALSFWPGSFWTVIADDRGWFEEAGLEVEGVDTDADYYRSIDDLIAGKLDAQQMPLYDLLLRNIAGADLVGVIVGDHSSGDSIVVRPSIGNVAGLAGKKVGIVPDTYLEYLLDQVLRTRGLSIADVVVKNVSLEQTGRAFRDDAGLAAVVTWEPFAADAIAAGGKVIYSSAETPGLMPDVWVFRREFIERRPDDVRKFVAVWRRTTDHIVANPAGAHAVVARIDGRSSDEVARIVQAARILTLADNRAALSYAAGSYSVHTSARRIVQFLVERGVAKESLDTDRMFDTSFIREEE